jgi:hypothetical protein
VPLFDGSINVAGVADGAATVTEQSLCTRETPRI